MKIHYLGTYVNRRDDDQVHLHPLQGSPIEPEVWVYLYRLNIYHWLVHCDIGYCTMDIQSDNVNKVMVGCYMIQYIDPSGFVRVFQVFPHIPPD